MAPGPAPRVLWVKVSRVAQGAAGGVIVDADAAPALAESGAVDVASTTRIEIKFDRYMLPTDVIRQAICLRSTPGTVANANDCVGNVFLHPTYDPVRRVVTYYQDGTSGSGLVAGQLYTLTVLPGSGPAGFQAFDGVALDQRYEYSFTVAASPMALTEAAPTENAYCAGSGCGDQCDGGAAQVFRNSCSGCHDYSMDNGANAANGLPQNLDAATGLFLTSMGGLSQTAIGKTALETEEGGGAQHATSHPRRFGVAMAVVQPSDPGQSYLLYKLLADARFPLDPNDAADQLAEGEANRLRLSVVSGVPMPARSFFSESFAGDPAAWYADIEKISHWIAAGAQLPVCSKPSP